MEFSQSLGEEVLRRVDEIRRYYSAWEASNGGTPLISKTMLAFSLGLQGAGEVDALLEQLERRGGILGVQGDLVRLSPRSFESWPQLP